MLHPRTWMPAVLLLAVCGAVPAMYGQQNNMPGPPQGDPSQNQNGQPPNDNGNRPSRENFPRRGLPPGASQTPPPQQQIRPQASALPATPPTSLPAPAAQIPPIAATAVPATSVSRTTAKRATVTYENGLLNVRADDSSLDQILHIISRRTGMTITGGVTDQRVFGDYGPADPSAVIATLLDGTGVNMLLRESADNKPVELVLTQRSGGATPPDINAGRYDDDEDKQTPPQPVNVSTQPAPSAQPQPTQPAVQTTVTQTPAPTYVNNPLGSPNNTSPTAATLNTTNSVPIDTLPTPTTAQEPSGIVDAPNPPPPGSTSDANGTVSTPESIMQQLQAIQARNSKAAGAATAGTPSTATTTTTSTTTTTTTTTTNPQ